MILAGAGATLWNNRGMRGLSGKSIVVAGGGSGIGAATAMRLASHGARVLVGDHRADKAQAVAADIRAAGGTADGRSFDIVDEESVRALVATAIELHGGLDGMHVNAADLDAVLHDGDAVDVPLAVVDRTLAVNLRGHLLCTRHAVPALLARGGGSIVYTSSGAAFMGEPARVAYAMSKNGLHALLRHVASRWGRQGVRANAVAPGPRADRSRVPRDGRGCARAGACDHAQPAARHARGHRRRGQLPAVRRRCSGSTARYGRWTGA